MNSNPCFLLLEPDEPVRTALTAMICQRNWIAIPIKDECDLIEKIQELSPKALICETSLSDLSAAEILNACKDYALPVVFLGHSSEVQGAVDLMRDGAIDFLEKPFPQSRLIETLQKLTANGRF